MVASCWKARTALGAEQSDNALDVPAQRRFTQIRTGGATYSCERLVLVEDFDSAFCNWVDKYMFTTEPILDSEERRITFACDSALR